MDSKHIPSAEDIRARLQALNLRQMDVLAALSEVPVGTLMKIRNGQTPNPRLETVRQLVDHLKAAAESAAAA